MGWNAIASAGIYGKGKMTRAFTLPMDINATSLYVNDSFGAEAKFFCLKTDLEIYKTQDYYLAGSPDSRNTLMPYMLLNMGTVDWQAQSREYIYMTYDTALMEVGEDNLQVGAQTVASGVYPYSDVQLAALGNRDLLAVWTVDPGGTFTSLDSVGMGAYDGAISSGRQLGG